MSGTKKRAVNKAKNYQYILRSSPDQANEKIGWNLPGMKSPTVIPLAEEGWRSIHSVIREDEFWEIIEHLKVAGARRRRDLAYRLKEEAGDLLYHLLVLPSAQNLCLDEVVDVLKERHQERQK